jgi:hypothetical protein
MDCKVLHIYKRQKDLIANDSTVRVFTLNETIVLYLNNFEILKTIDRKPMLTTPMSLLQKLHNYLIAKRYSK